LKEGVRERVETRITILRNAFSGSRRHLADSEKAARTQITTALRSRRAEVDTKAGANRTGFAKNFSDHRAKIEKAVTDAIAAGEVMKTGAQDQILREATAQVKSARKLGEEQAATYPESDRGRVQREAALGVADKTALEMQKAVPEAVAACGEVVQEVPEG